MELRETSRLFASEAFYGFQEGLMRIQRHSEWFQGSFGGFQAVSCGFNDVPGGFRGFQEVMLRRLREL